MEDESRETYCHKLIVPADSNHHGTLYAGALLRIALEAAYATAYRQVGHDANLVLRRVINLECLRPVPVGSVIEIRGRPLLLRRAYVIVGLIGTPLEPNEGPWMQALMGFVQVDQTGLPVPLPEGIKEIDTGGDNWKSLREKLTRLLAVR